MPFGREDDARPLITFEDVTLAYGRVVVLSGLSFSIREGDCLGLVGPNGAGKTTLVRGLLGMVRPRAGRIRVHVPGLRVGYVPQRQALDATWPLRAVDVVAMGRYHRVGLFRRPGARDRALARAALEQVGIGELAEQPYRALSGGQKQRVLIARALIGDPELLVLDEPTDGMDLSSAAAILELVRGLHAAGGRTVVMVSHQLNEVANYVARLALVQEGRFQVGRTEEVLTEENLTALYGVPVTVEVAADGRRLVFVRRPEAAGVAGRPERAARAGREKVGG